VTTADLEKCKTAGMDDYIAKPVDERVLYNKIMKLLKKPLTVSEHPESVNGEEKQNPARCIDLHYLLQRTKSNPILMMEMIKLYLDQTPILIGVMKESLRNRDWGSLHAAVHKIIPSFSIMGIDRDFENMAKKIQDYAATQGQFAGIQEMFLKIETVCSQACKELEVEFNTLNENKLKEND
jgi:CheY-like chemotaxis protein